MFVEIAADGKTIDATQEMLAVGMSNVLGSFVQSIPVAASVTRTSINHNAGAQTPLGGILAGKYSTFISIVYINIIIINIFVEFAWLNDYNKQ
jgi:MFS superfamily sulfate permease-like transporter